MARKEGRKNMKKLILLAALLLAFSGTASAQTLVQSQTFAATLTTNNGLFEGGQNVSVHNIKWSTSGTVSTCTVTIDTAPDNATWSVGGAIPSTTCTAANGSVTVYNVTAANYVRINLSTLTGGGSITITYTGYINSTVAGPIGGQVLACGTLTPAATSGTLGPQAQTMTCTGLLSGDQITPLVSFVATVGATGCSVSDYRASAANTLSIDVVNVAASACTIAAKAVILLVVR